MFPEIMLRCSECLRANAAIPGVVSTVAAFDRHDTHSRLAKHYNGIVKCSPSKAAACSVKSVFPNQYMYRDQSVGPATRPLSCMYELSVNRHNCDNAALLECACTGELVRYHRLWPRANRWVFCGYYRVSAVAGGHAVHLTLVG